MKSYRGKNIELTKSGYYKYYSDKEGRFKKFDRTNDLIQEIESELEDKFTPHAYMNQSNFGGIEIQINDTGDGVRTRDLQQSKIEISEWVEIEYKTNPEDIEGDLIPFFKDPYSNGTYSLNEFMRF